MFTWGGDVGRHPGGYQEGKLPGGEIKILQAAQGRGFTYWEGSCNRSAVSEVHSWLSRLGPSELQRTGLEWEGCYWGGWSGQHIASLGDQEQVSHGG